MKRRKRIKLKKNALIICLFLFLILCLCIFFLSGKDKAIEVPKENIPNVEVKDDEKSPKVYEVKMIMVGDALIHDRLYNTVRNEDGSYDFKPTIQYIKPIITKYDLKYYNQETILGGAELGYSSYPQFNSPNEVGDAFLDAGFNLVSLATNHTMDKGERGVLNSVNYWKSKKNVVYSGQWSSWDERNEVHVYDINGISYAFFSYTTWTNGLETPNGKEYLNNVYSDEKAANDISKIRDLVDVVIVAMHWGTEYSLDVSSSQQYIANYLAGLGVDLIIGSHPHVVEPVEYINNGKTFVIYSLGNFLSAQYGIDRLTGLMVEVTIKKVVDVDGTITVSIESPKAELTYTQTNDYTKYRVYPYSKLNSTILPDYMNYYEYYKGIVSSKYQKLEWGLSGE
ncbi:MAG: CapA family protein [Tenericutes bacterium]|nr:CapA family protein [Mycoplasmatota bacterium]